MSPIMSKSVDSVNHSADSRAASVGRAATDDGVLELIHSVMHQFRAQQFQALRDGRHDVTHMESKVLGFFSRHAGATQSDLVAHSGRDKAQLARLIKGLRERGLLDGEADDIDRRNVRLRLTADGNAVQRRLRAQGAQLEAQAVAGLSAADREALRQLLMRVKRNLDPPEV
ncbi:MAG: MarR family transcriptional regulator [Rhizobacter sp.]|nr:MarR family transcriptional regulator [Rhizobacter sp.]